MSLETDIYTSTLYTDMATGLGDTALEQKQYVLDKTTCSAHLEFQIPTGAIRLCFHPLDNGGTCIIKNLHISDESGQLPYSALGGEPMGEYRIFSAESPRFSITPSHSSKVLQIDLQIYPMEETVLQACLEQFDHLQDTAREAQHNADNYRRQNEASSIQLQAIQRSFFWRLTKPLRAVSGGIKKVMRSSRFMRLIYHGLASIRHFGIRATCSRILFKLTKGRRGRNPIIGNPLLQNVYGHPAIPEDILFSIIVPLYNTPEVYLAALINSIKAQVYTNWELCLADGSEQGQDLKSFVSRCAAGDARIKYKRLEKNQGISGNSNEALAMAQGDFIVLADHDDLLSPDALYENAVAVYETSADVLYSDEDHVDEQGNHFFPFFKPDWSPDLLYAQMYICHLLVIRKSTFYKAGIFDSAYDGSQDYDLMLRLSEITDCIYHIPQVLYSWRETKGSTSVDASAKPYAQDAGLRALNAHLSRKYGSLAKAFDSEYLFVYDTRFYTMQNQPLVSIIIPMKDHWEMTRDCVASILKSSYRHFEIILINNNSELPDSLQWLEQIGVTDERIHVIDAAFSFNWSKLNNWGMKHAKGDVFVFLNNDIIVDSNDWLERLCENALRDEIGAVGCLLRYENGTIQHAGVGLGLGGWADHIFKGMRPEHFGSPYVSPMVNRNVLAVTGACLAVSRKTVEKIGAFDESFIICGSDVEFCLRAYRHGFFNLYDARVTLFHLESKSRDSYIPDEDFKRSAESYAFYLENGDPFLNLNLDLSSTSPRQDSEGKSATIDRFQNYLQKHPGQKQKTNPSRIINPLSFAPFIAEVNPMEARESAVLGDDKRLNLLIPSLNTEGVFGGIATALSFFQALLNKMGPEIKARVIVLDAALDKRHRVSMPGYVIHAWNEDSADSRQIVDFFDRRGKTIPVGKNDIFMATGWWTAYMIEPVIHWQAVQYSIPEHSFIYFIQDFEPGFYPWSSKYVMAESTYQSSLSKIAIFNSSLLMKYMEQKGYAFPCSYCFEPTLNKSLAAHLQQNAHFIKEKQILIYGRPSTPRNAFELIVMALRKWSAMQTDISEWKIYSAGEPHPDIELCGGAYLQSLGKLSLRDYARLLGKAYMGISLMVSPHPSYPPLEMASFGVKTITNMFSPKDLSTFSKNIVSLRSCNEMDIANALHSLADQYSTASDVVVDLDSDYVTNTTAFSEICSAMAKEIWL